MAPVTPPTATSQVRPTPLPSPLSTPAPLPLDSIMLPDHQTTTSNTTPWISPTLHRFQQERDHVPSTFEVGGPSDKPKDNTLTGSVPDQDVASRSKGNQDSRRRDAGYTGYKAKDSGRRPGK
ncbi:hypothetical protein Tco_0552262 [Tanacetum coccineum]